MSVTRKHRRDPNRPAPEGSTYFPKFPAVDLDKGFTSPTRMFALDDVKKMRLVETSFSISKKHI